MPAEIVKIGAVSGSVSGGLRYLADRIDANKDGEFDELQFAVVVTVDRGGARFVTWGYGPHSILEALGALSMAIGARLVYEE